MSLTFWVLFRYKADLGELNPLHCKGVRVHVFGETKPADANVLTAYRGETENSTDSN